jgi:hypothetical protein
MQFSDYISDDRIIRHLCKQRIKQAKYANDHHYVERFIGELEPRQPSDLQLMLPPRRNWSRFRPRDRSRIADVNLVSLCNATMVLRQSQPELEWACNLQSFLVRIRERILGDQPFTFARPEIRWELKEGNKYRALCGFSLEDNLIISLVASYVRDFCDPAFENSSYAFRARPAGGSMPTHHIAFEDIYQIRTAHSDKKLFVAECDIRGFYDSVDHGVALNAFRSVVNQVQQRISNRVFHPRAEQIFRAYLDCYSFPDNVLGEAAERLKSGVRNNDAFFPWPEDGLHNHHTNPRSERIGVPQGGALSCIIANLVLDLADKRIKAGQEQLRGELHYFRYCDDMIILATKESTCKKAFQIYLDTLYELKLPYHPAKSVSNYDRTVWEYKSKAPYCWTGSKGAGRVPWVQFVGYQIRYDGLVRIKKKSVEKQVQKVKETVDDVKFALLNEIARHPFPLPYDPPSILATRSQVIHSVRQKLAAMSVGRIKSGNQQKGHHGFCWANGFKALNNKPIVPTFLKKLDRNRERQLRRMKRAPITYGPGRVSRNPLTGQREDATGYKYSYAAQFKNTGGTQLILTPYRSVWVRCRFKLRSLWKKLSTNKNQ